MHVISRRTLREFWSKPEYSESRIPLEVWHSEATRALWTSFASIKETYGSASAVGSDRVVFNIGGNKYRLVVRIDYRFSIVFIRFIGTHSQYDKIDAGTV